MATTNEFRTAIVRPRVTLPGSTTPRFLEEVVREEESGKRRKVVICGPPGAGRTTAAEYLVDAIGGDFAMVVIDGDNTFSTKVDGTPFIVETRLGVLPGSLVLLPVTLTAWSKDDLIEFLLQAAPQSCGSVMARINATGSFDSLMGSPAVWRLVLDAMIQDESIDCVMAPLEQFVDAEISQVRRQVEAFCLAEMIDSANEEWLLSHGIAESTIRLAVRSIVRSIVKKVFMPLPKAELPHPLVSRLLFLAQIRRYLAATGVLRAVTGSTEELEELPVVSSEVLDRAAELASAAIRERLQEVVRDGREFSKANAAGLLLRLDQEWRPEGKQPVDLEGAELAGARWNGVCLEGRNIRAARLSEANLSGAQMTGLDLDKAVFAKAQLIGATLDSACGAAMSFGSADLSGCSMVNAMLRSTSFRDAILDKANLRGLRLSYCNFEKASLRSANLIGAQFARCRIRNAIFTDACLSHADLGRHDLSVANFEGADFSYARLMNCRLENMHLENAKFSNADLTRALLTYSCFHNADFQDAKLCKTGLAEIDWEGANLQGANLRGSTFHLGSSRSGLLSSFIASEGTRTGFYTDDYRDQSFRAPEEIRKANLRGANLRGAKLDDVDFYLVDLRDAVYDAYWHQHFVSCGAILD